MNHLAKIFLFLGGIFIILGFIFFIFSKINIPFLGRLPGDILIEKKNFTFYFPLTTCLLISLILSLIFLFFFRR
ncbi:MAG TPA: DUF2905 domain-containing protein [Candidatus Omnitrophica bacterium]|nr:MAG: DUF2905 domain-containing protein [Candidatus Omnitrophota bacterium]RKY35656.1 MAG: DUF2905 domain-containing protein [Candidatus Omnitrophota bacterium]RKY43724.1 MAG: DUF2905 domain-containing protein [Candidatus Omnitrophota bacterium]HEC69280.1 DUF2905 domain-containing protein [Candidatus Omnitrophota bacterium]